MDQRSGEVLRVVASSLALVVAVGRMVLTLLLAMASSGGRYREIPVRSYSLDFHRKRANLRAMIYTSETTCFNQIRMYPATFDRLCAMLQTIGGLKPTNNMYVDEQVAMFLHILAHHVKSRVIQVEFGRSGETISRYFKAVLNATVKLHSHLLKRPEPIPDDSEDARWKWFRGCLGALDGTHIRVTVPAEHKARYRNRKGEITTNVLGVCSPDGEFIFVLPGWEGSAADGRVLRDAIRREGGLKVPTGTYYLVDAGYTNCDGFLAPYRGQRYHLNEWRHGYQPQSPQECFNMRHAAARNVIERCFGTLKKRWAILRSPSFYPVKIQTRCIVACCLLHNLIRRENRADPVDDEVEAESDDPHNSVPHNPPIGTMETSVGWNIKRDEMANEMFNAFVGAGSE